MIKILKKEIDRSKIIFHNNGEYGTFSCASKAWVLGSIPGRLRISPCNTRSYGYRFFGSQNCVEIVHLSCTYL